MSLGIVPALVWSGTAPLLISRLLGVNWPAGQTLARLR
jgi:hypothetical protein